jgi:hypothetical protein
MDKKEPQEKKQDLLKHQLAVKLDRLSRVKEELWQECQPIPPELEQKIREVRKELGME